MSVVSPSRETRTIEVSIAMTTLEVLFELLEEIERLQAERVSLREVLRVNHIHLEYMCPTCEALRRNP